MLIEESWELKFKELWAKEKFTEAKKMVFELRMKKYNKIEVEDKIILDYRMAYLEYLEGNRESSNMYLKILGNIFDEDYSRKSNENYYYRYRWLYVNNNKDDIDKELLVNEMINIYRYYKEIKDEETALLALGNVAKIKGDNNLLIDNLEKLLIRGNISDWNLIKSIIKDCGKISHDLYITALELIDKYKFNIDLQVV